MTTPPAADIEAIRKRHDDLCIMYGGEPWDESCVEDGEQAHMDRGVLLEVLSTQGAGVTAERADLKQCPNCGINIGPDGVTST